jgi:hypothetical protein
VTLPTYLRIPVLQAHPQRHAMPDDVVRRVRHMHQVERVPIKHIVVEFSQWSEACVRNVLAGRSRKSVK